MSQFVLRFIVVSSVVYASMLPSAYADQHDLQARKIAWLKKELVNTQAKLERVQHSLTEAKTQLQLTKKEQVKASKNAEANNSELAIRMAKLVDIRYDRYVSKVSRLESKEHELKQSIKRQRISIEKLSLEKQSTLLSNSAKPTGNGSRPTKMAAVPVNKIAVLAKSTTIAKAPSLAVQKRTKDLTKTTADPVVTGAWPSLTNERQQDIVFAQTLLQTLAKLRAQGIKLHAPLDKVEVYNTHSFDEKKMQYLGNNIYSLVEVLKPGKQVFTIFNNTYWHTVPDTGRDEKYRMIYDISSVSNPQFHLFKESLITQRRNTP